MFTYQGHLHHAGAPATGLYEITFALYDAATNGNTITTVDADGVALTAIEQLLKERR